MWVFDIKQHRYIKWGNYKNNPKNQFLIEKLISGPDRAPNFIMHGI